MRKAAYMQYLRRFAHDVYSQLRSHPFAAGCLSLIFIQILLVAVVGGLLSSAVQTTLIPSLANAINLPTWAFITVLAIAAIITGLIGLALGYRQGSYSKTVTSIELRDLSLKIESFSSLLSDATKSLSLYEAQQLIDNEILNTVGYLTNTKNLDGYLKSIDVLLVICLAILEIPIKDAEVNTYLIKPELPSKEYAIVFRCLRGEANSYRKIKLKSNVPGERQGTTALMFIKNKLVDQVLRDDPYFQIREMQEQQAPLNKSVFIIDVALRYENECKGVLRIETGKRETFNKIKGNPNLKLISSKLGHLLYIEEQANAHRA
jgi:hypothetical protein